MAFSFEETIPCFTQLSDTFALKGYVELPENWWVIITDVENSTQAIADGRYRDINAVGGGTIAALMNAVKPLKVPYVFGGDGAAFCIPPELLPKVKRALRGCQELAAQGVGLSLRVGLVPYADLNKQILVCRYQGAPNLVQYFFMGGGMEEADASIKANRHYHLAEDIQAEADFSGFECRWNEIPSAKEVTLSLLVKSRLSNQSQTLSLYQELMVFLQRAFGSVSEHHPLNRAGLSLSLAADKLQVEVNSKRQQPGTLARWWQRQQIRLENLIGSYWMAKGKMVKGYDWGNYKTEIVENSDYIKLDDTYRTVMSGDRVAVQQLLAWLETRRTAGQLFYGCHQTHSAIITCLVTKTGVEHIHFVDSAEGGYAMAAKQLKAQIAQQTTA